MKSTSTIYPPTIQIGKIKRGIVECFVAWDVVEKQIELDDDKTQTVYEHEYAWIDWVIDDADYIQRVNGQLSLTAKGIAYFEENADEIVKWAKPAGI